MKSSLGTLLYLLLLIPLGGNGQSGMEIIEKSIQTHDPNGSWSMAKFAFHFEEPRLLNPKRFSIVKLDNNTGAFEMQRSRSEHISTHIISSKGLAITLLDGVVSEDTSEIKEYRLESERNTAYRSYYDAFCGMPMNLPARISKIKGVKERDFNSKECFQIEVKLREPLFSDYWKIYIEKESYQLAGIEIITDEDKMEGERLYFEKIFDWDGMKIIRMRHWHELKDDSYLGSDILVNTIY